MSLNKEDMVKKEKKNTTPTAIDFENKRNCKQESEDFLSI